MYQERTLKIGDTFTFEDMELVLHEVVEDKHGTLWAIGIAEDGAPFVVDEDSIPDAITEVVLTLPNPTKNTLPKKGKK